MFAVVTASPAAREPLHRHEEARLVLFLAGEYVERSFTQSAQCFRGAFVVRPAYYAHGGIPGEAGAHYLRLGISPIGARAFHLQHGWSTRTGRVALDQHMLAELVADPRGGDALLAQSRLLPLAAAAPKSPISRIAEQLSVGDATTLEELAEENALTPWRLSRIFKREHGVAPGLFRLQARLQRALRLMAETSSSIAAIAAETGFTDQSHLAHALRRFTGLTPVAMRRAIALA